jgi:hypothetical protein
VGLVSAAPPGGANLIGRSRSTCGWVRRLVGWFRLLRWAGAAFREGVSQLLRGPAPALSTRHVAMPMISGGLKVYTGTLARGPASTPVAALAVRSDEPSEETDQQKDHDNDGDLPGLHDI